MCPFKYLCLVFEFLSVVDSLSLTKAQPRALFKLDEAGGAREKRLLLPLEAYKGARLLSEGWTKPLAQVADVDLRKETTRFYGTNVLIGDLAQHAVRPRPDGLPEVAFLLMQEFENVGMHVIWEGNRPSVEFGAEESVDFCSDREEFAAVLARVVHQHMKNFEDNGDPNFRRSSREFSTVIRAIAKYGMEYALTVKHVLVCPHVLDLRKGEHKIVASRMNFVEVNPAAPLKVDSSGKTSVYKKLKALPWHAVNTEGGVPVNFHSRRSMVDAETSDFWLYWFRSAQEQAKTPRSRKLWAERRLLGVTDKHSKSPKLNFGCPGSSIYSHADPHNQETVNHCMVFPVKVNELFPEEVAIIQCSDIYPVGTKAVYAKDETSGGGEFRWYLRACTRMGWTPPKHMDERSGTEAHRRCRSSQAVAPTKWGFPSAAKEPERDNQGFGQMLGL